MTTVSIHMPELIQGTQGQDSGYLLLLSKPSDRSAVNGAGDMLVWAGNKWLTADVGESWTETLAAYVLDSNSLAVRDGWLAVGETVVVDSYPGAALNGGISRKQQADLIMAVLAGETSQPSGTTEKFKHLDGTDAFTTTFDSNGNRTDVAIA